MADYTGFATPADEWMEFEKSYKPAPLPANATRDQFRDHFNESRAKLFNQVLGLVG
jgi:hypothetical protein